MRLLSRVRSWLSAVTRRSHMEGEMDAELRFHIEHLLKIWFAVACLGRSAAAGTYRVWRGRTR